MKTLSIYVKLIVYFLAVALTPMLVVGLLAYYKINNVIRADNQRMLRAIATDTAYKVERDKSPRGPASRSCRPRSANAMAAK